MHDKQNLQTTLQGAQLLVLIIGIIAAMTTIGRRDAQIGRNIEDLRELRNITEDLLKTSISVQISDQYQNEQLARLLERITRLEG
tara:strand:- start:76 stop:330 length:255 start_codon:yes stop_codon:yes gene_type:complete